MNNKNKALALGFEISHALGADAFIQIVSTLAPATLIYSATKSKDNMIVKNVEMKHYEINSEY